MQLPDDLTLDSGPKLPDDLTLDSGPSVGMDVLKSIPGDIKGAAATFGGWPGDLVDLAKHVANYAGIGSAPGQDLLTQIDQGLASKLGLNPDTKILRPLTSSDIMSGLDTITGGPSYQPQTAPGKDVRLASELVPSLIGGPEAMTTKLATRIAGPVLGSEVGGQAAKAVGLPEEAGRTAGMLLGGPASALNESRRVVNSARQVFPETQALHNAATAMFDKAGLGNVELNPAGYRNFATGVYGALQKAGYNPALSPAVSGVIGEIIKTSNNKLPITMQTVENLRQQANNLYKIHGESGAIAHKFAHTLTSFLDAYTENLSGNDVISGNATQATALAAQARDLWSRFKKAQTIDNIITLAENKGGVNFNEAGTQTAIRQGINNLLTRIQKGQEVGWTPTEIATLRKVAKGAPVTNAARYLGRFAPHGLISSFLSGSTGAATLGTLLTPFLGPLGPVVGGAIPLAAGEVAGRVGHALTLRAARHARDVAAAGGAIAPLPKMMTTQGLLGLLYAGAPALSQQSGQNQ